MANAVEFTFDELLAARAAVLLEQRRAMETRRIVVDRAGDRADEKPDKLVSYYDTRIRCLEGALAKLEKAIRS